MARVRIERNNSPTMFTIPQIEALKSTSSHLYESLKRLLTGVNAIGTTNKLSLDSAITDGAEFARVSSDALTLNAIDPSKPGILAKGSIPPTWNASFTYTSAPTTVTWSWSSFTVYRADGTTTAIPNGSLVVTGLTAGTSYFFYPYWDESAAALNWVAGGSGTPANAQSAKTNIAAQQQSLQARIPLSQGAMVAATPLADREADQEVAAVTASDKECWSLSAIAAPSQLTRAR